jgi:hypothetical protein
MEICVLCDECGNELIVKGIEIDRGGAVLVKVERCLCKDEEIYNDGFNSGVEYNRKEGY